MTPPSTTLVARESAPIAQRIEQVPSKHLVAGSSPAGGAGRTVVGTSRARGEKDQVLRRHLVFGRREDGDGQAGGRGSGRGADGLRRGVVVPRGGECYADHSAGGADLRHGGRVRGEGGDRKSVV